MSDKIIKLESGTMNYDMIFENGMVAVSFIRKLKECRYDQVVKVVQKNTSLGGGDELSFRIYFIDNGKEQSFPWVQARVNSPQTKECLEHMKLVFPETVIWTDARNEKKTDASGRTQYDLQYLPFGYAGAGLPRVAQLSIYMIALAVLVIPLFYYIYLLAKGGYRIYTTADEIEIKKTGSVKWLWKDITKVHLTNVNVVQKGTNDYLMKIEFTHQSGQSNSVVMRYDQALPLMKEMAEHGLVSEELLAKYA